MKFKLEIELGDGSMRTRKQLVRALMNVACHIKIYAIPINKEEKKAIFGFVKGKPVGSWALVNDPSPNGCLPTEEKP